jgi:hypothetical protein
VKSCYESPFLILGEPEAGSDMYTVAYQVDDSGKEMLIALGRGAGSAGSYPACQTCTNESGDGLLVGFRAEVYGTITSDGVPPILNVSMAFVSNGQAASEICTALAEPMTNSPTAAPRLSVPVTATPIQTTSAPEAPTEPAPISDAPITSPPVTLSASPTAIMLSGGPLSTSPIVSIEPSDSASVSPSSDLPVPTVSLTSNSSSAPSNVPTAAPFVPPSSGFTQSVGSQNAPNPSSASPSMMIMSKRQCRISHYVFILFSLLITYNLT